VFVKRSRLSFFGSVNILMRRMFVNLVRSPDGLHLRLVQFVLLSFLIWLFSRKLSHDQNSVQNRFGYIYESIIGGSFLGMLSAVGLFPDVRDVYYRESRDGMYSASAFILSYTLHALPTDVLSVTLYLIWSFTLIGLQFTNSGIFANFFAIVCGLHFGESLALIFLLVFRSTVSD
jgi:ATP-binding cassette subfamily G (WHITE) protein 5 (sterolin 1)